MEANEQRELPAEILDDALQQAWVDLLLREDAAHALARVTGGLVRVPLDGLDPLDRPYAELAALHGFWRANVLSALLFTAIHWPHWLWTLGISHVLATSGPVFLLGLVMGLLTRLGGSLAPAVAVHTLNNALVATLLQ